MGWRNLLEFRKCSFIFYCLDRYPPLTASLRCQMVNVSQLLPFPYIYAAQTGCRKMYITCVQNLAIRIH